MAEKDISEIVKQLRIRLKLTQEQFAAKIGVTSYSVNIHPYLNLCLLTSYYSEFEPKRLVLTG